MHDLEYGIKRDATCKPSNQPQIVVTCLLLTCFAIVVFVGGHGIGVMGLVLFLGWEELAIECALGWAGVALLFVSDLVRNRLLLVVSLMGLLACFALMVRMSDEKAWPLVTATPFYVMVIVKLAMGFLKMS